MTTRAELHQPGLELGHWFEIKKKKKIKKKTYFSLFPLQKEASESRHSLSNPAVKTEPSTEKANKSVSLLWKRMLKRIL